MAPVRPTPRLEPSTRPSRTGKATPKATLPHRRSRARHPRPGALDPAGREALLRYVLRPPVAQERVEQRSDGLVRITLKKAYTDGTIAVDMDPLSLLCRLA